MGLPTGCCCGSFCAANGPRRARLRLRRGASRSAVTLVEMLIALTMTLVIMGAVLTLFGSVGDTVNQTRAAIEMGDRLRSATFRLRQDLQNATTIMQPPRRPEWGEGYLEYFEGPATDWQRMNTAGTSLELQPDPTLGDIDDLLCLTVRAGGGENFTTVVNNVLVEAPAAEVVWFVALGGTTAQPSWNLYRRQLLVAPHAMQLLPNNHIDITADPDWGVRLFRNNYDLSHRIEIDNSTGTPRTLIVLNTLGDLTKRESRYMRPLSGGAIELSSYSPTSFAPLLSQLQIDNISAVGAAAIAYKAEMVARVGEDIALPNLKSFDVQVFDSTAQLRTQGSRIVGPGDPGYWLATAANAGASGAYVDLAFMLTQSTLNAPPLPAGVMPAASQFSGSGHVKSKLIRTYDTYSYHYEVDGADSDGDTFVDEGTNPFAVSGSFTALDPETLPPYSTPLRSLQVKVRVYEPDSRQVRQVTVTNDFLPD